MATFGVVWDEEANLCEVTFDGSTAFDGAANAETLWTKGGYLKRITWSVPTLADSVTFRNESATGIKLFPTMTMDIEKVGNVYFDNLPCFPYVVGNEVTDGTVAVFEFVPRK